MQLKRLQLSIPKIVHLHFQNLCMFAINKLFHFLQNLFFIYMIKLLNAPNIFAKWRIEKFRQATSLPLFLKMLFYHRLLMSKFITNVLTGFVNFPVPVSLHEKPQITVKNSG